MNSDQTKFLKHNTHLLAYSEQADGSIFCYDSGVDSIGKHFGPWLLTPDCRVIGPVQERPVLHQTIAPFGKHNPPYYKDLSELRPAIDGILCHATLIGHKALLRRSTPEDANAYFNTTIKCDCQKCPAFQNCPICVLEDDEEMSDYEQRRESR